MGKDDYLNELEKSFKDIREKQEIALRNISKAFDLVGKWIKANVVMIDANKPDEEYEQIPGDVYLENLYGAFLVTDVHIGDDICIKVKSPGGLICEVDGDYRDWHIRGEYLEETDTIPIAIYEREFPDFKILTFDEVKDLYSKMFDEAKAFAFDTLEILKGEAR